MFAMLIMHYRVQHMVLICKLKSKTTRYLFIYASEKVHYSYQMIIKGERQWLIACLILTLPMNVPKSFYYYERCIDFFYRMYLQRITSQLFCVGTFI